MVEALWFWQPNMGKTISSPYWLLITIVTSTCKTSTTTLLCTTLSSPTFSSLSSCYSTILLLDWKYPTSKTNSLSNSLLISPSSHSFLTSSLPKTITKLPTKYHLKIKSQILFLSLLSKTILILKKNSTVKLKHWKISGIWMMIIVRKWVLRILIL